MLHKNTGQCKILIVPEEGWFGQPKYSTSSKNHPTLRRFLLLYSSLIWCMRISQNLDSFFSCCLFVFFAIALSEIFSYCPFPLVFLGPFVFHILSGCHKKLGVNYGQSLEMGL